MRKSILIAVAAAAALAGCQTPRESAIDASITCQNQGFRPGTKAYRNCQSANYVENRRAANDASNAVAAGVVAGAVGGALVGAAVSDRHYHRGYYARPYGYYGPGYGYGYYGY